MKVLILTASFGDGHNAAASSVRSAVEALDPENARVEVLDLVEAVCGRRRPERGAGTILRGQNPWGWGARAGSGRIGFRGGGTSCARVFFVNQ